MNLLLYIYYHFFSPCTTLCVWNSNTVLSTIFPYALFSDMVSVYVLYCLQVQTLDFACGKYA